MEVPRRIHRHGGRRQKITFTVTAYDEAGEIGHAQHERVIVKAERFLEKTYDKL